MIERQIESLSVAEQRTLEAAAVAGAEFSIAAVAAALEAMPTRSTTAARDWRGAGTSCARSGSRSGPTAPSRGATPSCMRCTATCSMSASRRRAARACTAASASARRRHGARRSTRSRASWPATSRRRARSRARSRIRVRAGDVAMRRHADREAVAHFRRRTSCSAGTRVGAERNRQELEVLVKLAAPLMATAGYAAPEVEAVFERAHALSRAAAPASATTRRCCAASSRSSRCVASIGSRGRRRGDAGALRGRRRPDRVGTGPLRTRRHAVRSAGARGRRPITSRRRWRSTIRRRTRPM